MIPMDMLGTPNPNYIKWESKFEIGIPVIDEQHKTLVSLCDRLYQELIQNKATGSPMWDESLKAALRECVEYVQTHFKDEEKLMKVSDYPRFIEHKKMHDTFIKKILDTTGDFEDATIGIAFKFVKFLYDWILSHIAHEDRLYVKCILDYYRRIKGL